MPYQTITASRTNCPQPPECQVCGGLECLCRPRFFAGQLLTEEDLRALDHYIIEKNKLHNRYLHGTGTVCGLQVLCHECKGWIMITSGYAIDPCGNDIIVCKDHPVDLCAMIRNCCAKARDSYDCEPMATPPVDCKDIERSWFVTLRYKETASRGITALKSSPKQQPCCSRCGSDAGGCGCGSHTNGSYKGASRLAVKSARSSLPQCEPTRTCEGYVVELAPVPPDTARRDNPNITEIYAGTFLGKIIECFNEVKTVIALKGKTPGENEKAFLTYKQNVWDFLNTHPLTRCQLLADVRAIKPVESPAAGPNFQGAYTLLDGKLDQFLHDCICTALLPPCPPDTTDPRVILATVTVKNDANGCRILNICHEHGRRFMLTSPNVIYWSSIASLIKQALDNACCGEPARPRETPPNLKSIEALLSSLQGSTTKPIVGVGQALNAVVKALGIEYK